MNKHWHTHMAAAVALLLIGGSAAQAEQPGSDDGWLAWQGCWQAQGSAPANLLCILPEGDGVRMIALVGTEVVSSEFVSASSTPRVINEGGCTGSELLSWSHDRKRLFVKRELTCGEKLPRRITGIMAMLSSSEWLSVEAVTAGSLTIPNTQTYRAVDEIAVPAEYANVLKANRLARQTARVAAIDVLDLDDVKEAVAHVDADAVVSWLTAANQEFDITGKKLVALADAGVPEPVIDVLVAVSNPDHFAIENPRDDRDGDDWRDAHPRVPRGGMSSCWDPYYSPMLGPVHFGYYGYDRCYSRSRYGYGYYSPWGWHVGYGSRTPIIIVRGNDNPGAKVTRKGYTRGRKDDNTTTSTSDTGRSSSTTTKATSGDSGSSSSSGSSGSGRRAKPRDQ